MVEIMNIKANPLQRLALRPEVMANIKQRAGAIVPESAAVFLAERGNADVMQAYQGFCQTQGLAALQAGAYNYAQPGELHFTAIIAYALVTGIPDAGSPFDLMQLNLGDSLTRAGITFQIGENLVSMKPCNQLPSQMAMMIEEASVTLMVLRQPTAVLAANITACQAAVSEILTNCLPKIKPQNQDAISLGLLGLSDIGQAIVTPETTLLRASERPSAPAYRQLNPPIEWYPKDNMSGESYLAPLTTRADAAGFAVGVHLSVRGPIARGLQAAP